MKYMNKQIPKVIHKIIIVDSMKTPEFDEDMTNAINSFKIHNPDYEIRIYNGDDCIDYIQKNYTNRELKTFNSLIPYSYKVDFMKMLILYNEGGIYSDMRQVCLKPFNDVFYDNMDCFVADDIGSDCRGKRAIMSFIVSVSFNDMFKVGINTINMHVEKKFYGCGSLCITGTCLFGAMTRLHTKYNVSRGSFKKEIDDGLYVYSQDNVKFILNKYKNKPNPNADRIGTFWSEWQGKGNDYNTLWHQRAIYATDSIKQEDTKRESSIRDDKYNTKTHLHTIPKKIHMTCKDKGNITDPVWIKCLEKIHKMYQDYEIIIYSDNDIYDIVEKHYPEHLEKIKKIKVGAVLADTFRYLILYLEGGIYFDMDCEPIKKLDDIFSETYYHGDKDRDNQYYIYPPNIRINNRQWDFYHNPCNNCKLISNGMIKSYQCLGHRVKPSQTLLCYEFEETWMYRHPLLKDPRWTYKNVGICQWFLASAPKQDIFIKGYLSCISHIDTMISLDKRDPEYHFKVIGSSGPLNFTKIVMDNLTDDINILPSDFFCAGSACGLVPETPNAYLIHRYTNSWGKN